jgi:LmbE family N-acetylglucosaminyl deacetylase
MRKVLVVAAHPDDEVLGCGGTIAWHTQQGDDVHVLIMAEGITSRGKGQSDDKLNQLMSASLHANEILGVQHVEFKSLPDNRLDSLDRLDITQEIEKKVDNIKPDIIYTHHSGDVNVDHRRIHESVITACRPMPGNHIGTLLCFEIASSTEWQTPISNQVFAPNWFVDISETLEIKMQALKAYESEMRPWPHVRSYRSLEYLARWRGATIGVDAAESFMLARNLILNKKA